MPKDRKGRFHINSQVARMHDRAAQDKFKREQPADDAQGHDGDYEEHEPAHHIEIHHHSDGSYHSVTYHADGAKENRQHPDFEDVRDHMQSAFQEGEDGQDHGADDKPAVMIALGKVSKKADDGAY